MSTAVAREKEPLVLRSPLLVGLGNPVHGFATRRGGVSEGPFKSLNLGRNTGDAPHNVTENHRRLAASAGFDLDRLTTPARQVHGATVVRAKGPADAGGDCDAIVTSESGVTVGVRTADCVPVLLWHPASGRAAAVHAGWRGVAASIVPAGVAAMDAPPAELAAAIGPAAGGCCYEVDDATLARIRAAAPATTVVVTRPGHARIDLIEGVSGQLRDAGLRDDRIDVVFGCTMCGPALHFSHRRDKGETGRHLSFIAGGLGAEAPSEGSAPRGGTPSKRGSGGLR